MNLRTEETDQTDACTAGITNLVLGIYAYLFLVVPILAFAIATAMNLGVSHTIAIAAALVMTGLYITEKTACIDN